jgi:hypothetical protein
MMKKTTTKKAKPASARRTPRTVEQAWRDDTRASNGLTPALAAPAAPPLPASSPTTAPATKPRPMARTHRRLATPAGRRGADLIRFLRIHAKTPYGTRGEEAIRRLAVEVGHLANLELNARTSTEGGR